MSLPSPKLVGLLHFVTGCDDLSFLRGFTKNFCFDAFLRYNDKICPTSVQELDELFSQSNNASYQFMVRFLSCMYSHHFASSFQANEVSALLKDISTNELLDMIRKRTWHKTIHTNNTLPSSSAIELHSKRLDYVLSSFANATKAFHTLPDPKMSGWIAVDGPAGKKLIPHWDSDESKTEINLLRKALLRKCGCKKNACSNKRCRCRKLENLCTTLCSCVGCKNNSESEITTQEDENNSDEEENEEDDEGEGDEEAEDVDFNEENDADQDEEEFNENIEELDELNFDIDFLEFQKDLYEMARKLFIVSADDQADDECDISNSDVLV